MVNKINLKEKFNIYKKSILFSFGLFTMAQSYAQIDIVANSAVGENITVGKTYDYRLGGCYREASSKAVSNFTVRLYLSQDNSTTIDANDILLGSDTKTLSQGTTVICSYLPAIKIPTLTWANNSDVYFIYIVDYNKNITETNENNNIAVSSPYKISTSTIVTTPGVPTSVNAIPGIGSATVSFTAPSNNGGASISKYTVTSSPDKITTSGTSSPLTITGLTPGVDYTFTVNATNSAGTSLESSASNSVKVLNYSVPTSPTNLVATASDAKVSVSFSIPSNNGGKAITGYTVTSNPGGIVANGTNSPIMVVGLTNGINYTFTAKASNEIGESVASNPSNSATPSKTAGDSLLAHYTFDGHVKDVSGNNNNGVASTSLSYGADFDGTPNAAAIFNGVDAFVTIPSPNTLKFPANRSFSIVASIKPSKNTGISGTTAWTSNIIYNRFGCPLDKSPDALHLSIRIADSVAMSGFRDNATNISKSVVGSESIYDQYHTLVLVRTIAEAKMRLYVDGILVNSVDVPNSYSNINNIESWIGKQNICNGSTNPIGNLFKGSMDDLKIYARALNTSEISKITNQKYNEYSSTKITIASNPSNTQFQLLTDKKSIVMVTDMNGQEIDSFVCDSVTTFGSKYDPGLYIVTVKTAQSTNQIKVIKY